MFPATANHSYPGCAQTPQWAPIVQTSVDRRSPIVDGVADPPRLFYLLFLCSVVMHSCIMVHATILAAVLLYKGFEDTMPLSSLFARPCETVQVLSITTMTTVGVG